MTKKKKTFFPKIFANDWVITLTATLIGVFVALYLNERVASNKLENQKSIAIENILLEITSNQEKLKDSIKKHETTLGIMDFLRKHMEEDENLIASIDSMNLFRNKFPNILQIDDSTLVANGKYNYKGELNFDLSITHLNLSTIALQTLKNSNISSTFDFECLMYLESIHKLTNEVLQKDRAILNFFIEDGESGYKNQSLFKKIDLLIQFQKSLETILENSDEELHECIR